MLFEPKTCTTCKKLKKPEEFYFRKQTNKLQGDCKICYQNKKRIRNNERRSIGELKYIAKKKKCLDCDNLCDARKRVLRCYTCEHRRRWKDEQKVLKHIEQNKKMWQNEQYKNKMRLQMKQQRKNIEFNSKLCQSFARSGRLSKLHQKIRSMLDLQSLGFVSEQLVDKYFVDELNEKQKIIIEINGDYIHANPKKFKPNDIIRFYKGIFTAAEKWESDKQKIDTLTSMGYRVITIWESDDLEEIKKQLNPEKICKNI